MFEGCDIRRIPNSICSARDQESSRKRLGIPNAWPATVFCADIAFDNPREGTYFLKNALNTFQNPEKFCLVVNSRGAKKWIGETQIDAYPVSFVEGTRL